MTANNSEQKRGYVIQLCSFPLPLFLIFLPLGFSFCKTIRGFLADTATIITAVIPDRYVFVERNSRSSHFSVASIVERSRWL